MTTANPRRRARERIGADQARAWARELCLKNPYAKSIMLAVANYMNEDGCAWPGLSTIARDTDISEDVCAKRLRWLEEIGVVALFKCWRDENGQRNYEGRGKPTSSEIRFLFDADIDLIEANALASAGDRPLRGAARRAHEQADQHDEHADEVSTRRGRGMPDEVSPRVAPEQYPPRAAPHIDESSEQEDSHPKPLPAGGAFPPAPPDQDEESLRRFAEVYPVPITDWVRALNAWRGLSAEERESAITGARGYAAFVRSKPDRPVNDAHRWLGGRKWIGYLVAGKEREAIDARFLAAEGSDEWIAWAIYYRACGKVGMPEFLVSGPPGSRVFNAARQWPPVGRGLKADESTWVRVFEGTGQFAAWRRRLCELPNAQLVANDTRVDGVLKKYLTVPCEWPPPKGEDKAA